MWLSASAACTGHMPVGPAPRPEELELAAAEKQAEQAFHAQDVAAVESAISRVHAAAGTDP
jgi:hypothetical protein